MNLWLTVIFWFKAIRENSGINVQAPTQGFVGRIDCKTMRKLQELTSQQMHRTDVYIQRVNTNAHTQVDMDTW